MPNDRTGGSSEAAHATRPLAPRIAVVFDFDDTLAHDSFDLLLEQVGLDPARIRRERLDPLVDDGWEGAMARIHLLSELDRSGEAQVTREALARAGREAKLLPDARAMFDRVRRAAHEADDGSAGEDLEVEFYVLSAGLGEVVAASPLASELAAFWACRCHFDEAGRVRGAKKVITHSEKAHYLQMLSRGFTEVRGNPPDPYLDVAEDDLYVPLSQVVYVGDGASDMAAFALIKQHGGIALGVYESEEAADWDSLEKVRRSRRVDNLARADYRQGSELMRSLELAAASVARRVALRRLGRGG